MRLPNERPATPMTRTDNLAVRVLTASWPLLSVYPPGVLAYIGTTANTPMPMHCVPR